ncbi:MAG: prephenate dehydrogenase/arogenate dehydrogenase family protein [Candidatus Aenigmarchaeota archaeon]|nr:prephenate dehydrogenase/arogenate dehydrogenase family protein [Candidatus Aenigmarchaeota archaeon]
MKQPTIGIIGGTHGLGNWFRTFFQKNKYPVLVSGRKTQLTNTELTKQSDIIIIAVPIDVTPKTIKEILPSLKDNSLLIDITSLKTEPVTEMKKAKKTVGVVGLHPMFGPLVTSIQNQHIAVCEARENKLWHDLKQFFIQNKANLIDISPEEHDRQMAVMQALLHFVNLSYVKTLQDSRIKPKGKFSTPVFQLQTMIFGRILGQNPSLYADIQIQNPEFKGILDSYIKITNDAKKTIENKDKESFVQKFNALKKELDFFIKTSEIKTTSILDQKNKTNINITFSKTPTGKIKKVSYLGPSGTNTHIVASSLFGNKTLAPSNTINSVFEEIINNDADAGIVPAENSTEGVVCETFDNLINSDVFVNTSVKQQIHHNLLARTKDINSIKTVVSHPQAIAQTRGWLKNNLPNAEVMLGTSTTKAIQQHKDSSVAFVGAREAAKEYNLNILSENIEDVIGNTTEFYVISKNKKLDEIYQPTKTLVAVIAYNRVGVLRDILSIFAKYSIDLKKLFSRPGRTKQWDYYFFIEADIKQDDPRLIKVLDNLKDYCHLVKVLGGTN